MPADVRSNLLSLSNFIDKRTVELLGDPKGEKAKVLININRNIGAGLMGNPNAEETASSDAVAQGEAGNGAEARLFDTASSTTSESNSAFAMATSPTKPQATDKDTRNPSAQNSPNVSHQPIDKKT